MLKAPMRGKFLGFMDGKAVIAQGDKLTSMRVWDEAERAFRDNQYRLFHMVIGIDSDGVRIREAYLLDDTEEEDGE